MEIASLLGFINEIAAVTDHSPDRGEILDRALQKSLTWMGLDRGGIFLFDEHSGGLRLVAQRGFTPESIAAGEGFIDQAAQAAQPQVVRDPQLPPEWVDAGIRSAAAVPIVCRSKTLGVVFAAAGDDRRFQPQDVELLAAIGGQMGAAVENARLLAEAQNRLAHLAALQETSRLVVSTLDLNALLKLIVEQAAALVQAEGGMLNLVDWDRQEDEVVAAAGLAAATLGIKIPLDCSLSGWVTLHNQPQITNAVREDPRSYRGGGEGIFPKLLSNAAAAPLTIKDRVIGTLVLVDKRGGTVDFDPSDLDLLVGLANHAAVAIENARLYQQAQRVAVMEERSRLARELHDAVTQTLFSANLLAEAVPEAWEKDPAEGRRMLGELRGLSRGALAEMRALLLELRPAALVETPLKDLLRQLGDAASGREGFPVTVDAEGEGTLPPEIHVALYRIAQEAMNNVVKHARAARVDIRLRISGAGERPDSQAPARQVWLSIADDGRGFDAGHAPHERLGLGIMRERAQSIGAALTIDSRPGAGTRVTISWERHSTEDEL